MEIVKFLRYRLSKYIIFFPDRLPIFSRTKLLKFPIFFRNRLWKFTISFHDYFIKFAIFLLMFAEIHDFFLHAFAKFSIIFPQSFAKIRVFFDRFLKFVLFTIIVSRNSRFFPHIGLFLCLFIAIFIHLPKFAIDDR